MATVGVEIDDRVLAEIDYLIALHHKYDPEVRYSYAENRETLVQHLLASVADGARRPGSWERQLLYPLGLIPFDDEHTCEAPELAEYRDDYGPPSSA